MVTYTKYANARRLSGSIYGPGLAPPSAKVNCMWVMAPVPLCSHSVNSSAPTANGIPFGPAEPFRVSDAAHSYNSIRSVRDSPYNMYFKNGV